MPMLQSVHRALPGFWRDLILAARTLRKRRGSTATIVLTMALGIGSTTAIFSLIYGILIRPFPYRQPDELVRVESLNTQAGRTAGIAAADLEDLRSQNRTFRDIAVYMSLNAALGIDGPAQPISATWATASLFSVLGVNPIIGRAFLPEEDRPGGDVNKVILSHRIWERQFGSDPQVLGRNVYMRRQRFTIVGVMAPDFRFPSKTDIWMPYESWRSQWNRDRSVERGQNYGRTAIGRLKPGVTPAQANADLDSIAADLEQRYPASNAAMRTRVNPLRDAEVGNIRPYLLLLVGAVGFVLLICCTNVANLLLAVAASRQREISVRFALGANRGRVIRQLLVESVVLSCLGGVSGVALSFFQLKALLALIPVTLPFWMRIGVDWNVLLFSLLLSLATGILFGITPALKAAQVDVSESLKEGSKGSGVRSHRVQNSLVILEVATSILLLVGAGLMLQTFSNLQNVEIGFQPRNVWMADVVTYRQGPPEEQTAALGRFFHDVLQKLETLPGVEAVGATPFVPFLYPSVDRTLLSLTADGLSPRDRVPAHIFAVSPGYFKVMGIPLLQGRTFFEADTRTSQRVVVLGERTARLLWPGESPIGRQLRYRAEIEGSASSPPHTVVGVVGNVKANATEDENTFDIYRPYTQTSVRSMQMLLRIKGDPTSVLRSLPGAIWEVDKEASATDIQSMNDVMIKSIWQRRLSGVLFGAFSILSLLLAAVGIYGVISHAVSQRTREVGIRMAIGARPQDVLALVIGRGMRLVFAGLAAGLAASLVLTRFLKTLLFGVSATDPFILAGTSLLLLLVALLACYLPARKAARANPLASVLHE